MPPLKIPFYSGLSPQRKQHVHLAVGGTVAMGVVLAASGFIGGGTPAVKTAPPPLASPKPLAEVPGSAMDSKDVWLGSAGRDVATLRGQLQDQLTRSERERAEQQRVNEQLLAELRAVKGQPGAGNGASASPATGTAALTPPPSSNGSATPGAAATAFPKLPAPGGANPAAYPPATPLTTAQARNLRTAPVPGGNDAAEASGAEPVSTPVLRPVSPPVSPPVLMRVSLQSPDGAAASPGAAAPGRAQAVPKRVDSFLPVSFTRAVLLGGLAAPTGGQAQGSPIPVLLRLQDLAVLPNDFRSNIRDCFVVGEGYGDISAERAYIRTTLMSCVSRDGRVMEIPIKGSVFGEDGMNGVMGKLVTKQGSILLNALLSGIASGLGAGVAQASQTVTTTALGTTSTTPPDTKSILQAGLGTGVSKALDRLAQYYINLAEKTLPVIEVLPGRVVDLVITEGTPLEQLVAAGFEGSVPERGGLNRGSLMRSLRQTQAD